MFTDVEQPLAYAELLLQQFANVTRATECDALFGDCAHAMAQLSGCELSQIYLLDASHKHLKLSAESLDGVLQAVCEEDLPADFTGEQLLQFALCQNRVVSVNHLNTTLYDIGFLPEQVERWQSLLCVPLLNAQQAVRGVLVIASRKARELQAYAQSLRVLGTFVLMQWLLLQPDSKAAAAPGSRIKTTGLVGKSAAMRQVYRLIHKVSHSPYTVLLLGETGTGKEVVARVIHEGGTRRSRPFVVQNCAAFPQDLLESELFGYRKGAFTGADRDRAGLFDAANGGTLLLDEIGDMPLLLQAKLLRVLQEGEVRPLGSNDTHNVDVRIIAATHQDLSVLVRQGKFREDLYYRLAQFPIELPALRQREGDVLELARHFAATACAVLQRPPLLWSDSALEQLTRYSFPGNVRELKGIVERAVVLCEGQQLQAKHFPLPADACLELNNPRLSARMEQFERGVLLDCLRRNAGNQTRTAHELGVARRTLLYRLKRLSIDSADTRRMAW